MTGLIKQQQQLQQPKVQFSETHEVAVVETVDDHEKSSVWYTKKDLDEIRKVMSGSSSSSSCTCDCSSSSSSSSAAMEKCDCKSSSKLISSPVAAASGRFMRKEFIAGLLQQQQELKQMGLKDPKGLFQFSRACSKKSRQEAIKAAKQQEEEVKSFQERKDFLLDAIGDVLDVLGS